MQILKIICKETEPARSKNKHYRQIANTFVNRLRQQVQKKFINIQDFPYDFDPAEMVRMLNILLRLLNFY